MLSFRDLEKERYKEIKAKLFSSEAKRSGFYNQIEREFCLADEYSYENLYQGIRDSAITYFLIRGIPWHDGLKAGHLPSNHLCCSQFTSKVDVQEEAFRKSGAGWCQVISLRASPPRTFLPGY